MLRCALALASAIVAGLPARAADPPAAPLVRQIVLVGPTIVAFLPQSQRSSGEAQMPSASVYATQAMGRVKWCLGARAIAYHVVYADRIVVHRGDHDEVYEVTDNANLPGALLLSPTASPRIVFAGGGPQALVPLLRQAASDYFGTTCRG